MEIFYGWSYNWNCLKQRLPVTGTVGAARSAHWHKSRCSFFKKGYLAMTKTMEVISEAVRNPKHPFRKVDNRPKKPLKHRYERRKIREYLHLGDWFSGELA